MKVLKGWVRQKAKPKGSMTVGYLHNEALFYSSQMLSTMDSTAPTAWEEAQDEQQTGLRLLGARKNRPLDDEPLYRQIQNYVLNNHECMGDWRDQYE